MALGGLRLAISAPHLIFWHAGGYLKVTFSILTFLSSPLHSLILGLKEYWIELKLRNDPKSKDLLHKFDEIHFHLSIHTKLELGLETILQSCLQLTLLFYAISETRTTEGLSAIFGKQVEKEIFGKQLEKEWTLTLLFLSTIWSFISNVLSHIGGLSSKRRHFPAMSKIVVALYSFFSITTRVMAIVIFFSPSLGLFNLLQHWKGEQVQWHPALMETFLSNKTVTFEGLSPIQVGSIFKTDRYGFPSKELSFNATFLERVKDKSFTIAGELQFGNSSQIKWSKIDHSQRYINGTVIFPDYTLYTGFKLKTFFFIFIAISVFHVMIICLVKCCFAKGFWKFNLLEKFIHCLESSHLPYNAEEWDSPKGNAIAHIKRMKANQLEGFLLILTNLVFKLGMISPLYVLGI